MPELRKASVRVAPSHHLSAVLALAVSAGQIACGRAPAPAILSGAAAPAPVAPPSVLPGASLTGKWVSAYYVGYHQSVYPPSAIAWEGLTHLIIARIVPNADGSLNTTFDIDATQGPALARALTSLAHLHGKKALVMIGGAGTHPGWISAASEQHRSALIKNLVTLAAEYGIDGFDLDWEPIEDADHPSFLSFARELRASWPAALLTLPVGWVSATSPSVPGLYAEAAPIFDQINIMSYGMAGAWPGWQSWHSSALRGASKSTPTSIESSVDAYLAAGVPRAKLGIGIATYGACWSAPVAGPKACADGSRVVADDNIMTFDHIMSSYTVPGSERWDESARASYLTFSAPHGPEGCTFISYESPRSILEKGDYVKQRGLGGAIVWTVSQGYRPSLPSGQRDPLLSALAEGFLR